MIVTSLLPDLKLHARLEGDTEDAGLVLMLTAAAGDVAHAASYTMPANATELPADLQLAVIDQATAIYDDRGTSEGTRGLTLAASRIVARYRGVRLSTPDTSVTPDA